MTLGQRNLVLGGALGLGVVALIAVFIVIFRSHGLPKDPDVWKRQERERSAQSASSALESTSTIAPSASTP